MADHNEQPTVEDIQDEIKHLEVTWENTKEVWKDTDLYTSLKFPIWRDEHKESRGDYHPSTAHNIVNHASDQNIAHLPVVQRNPVDPESSDSKESAHRASSALKQILMDSALHSPGGNPWRMLFKHLIGYGYGNIELSLDLSGPIGQRKMPGNWNPIRLEAVHPGRLLIDPLERVPLVAVRLKNYRVRDLKELMSRNSRLTHFNDHFDYKGRKPWEEVKVAVHWTSKWQTLVERGGDMLFSKKNAWGFVPVAAGYSGFGMEQTDMEKADPKWLAEGILDYIKDSIKMEAQSMIAQHTNLMTAAFSNYGTSQNPATFNKALDTGSILMGEEADFWKLKIDDLPRHIFEGARAFSRDIERGSMSPALMGERTPGITTMGEVALQHDIQIRKFSGPTQQVEYIASLIVSWISQLVDRLPQLKGGIGANGKVLTREDIEHSYHGNATFPILNQPASSCLCSVEPIPSSRGCAEM